MHALRHVSRCPSVLRRWTCLRNARCTYSTEPKIYDDPWYHVRKDLGLIEETEITKTSRVPDVDWSLVDRLMPMETVPPLPEHDHYPTPSGWQPPISPPPDLPYHVERNVMHQFTFYLNTRRDHVNVDTMEIEYVATVTLAGVSGDVAKFTEDLREYLEERVGHPVGTNFNELQGKITVKSADRSDVESFLREKGF